MLSLIYLSVFVIISIGVNAGGYWWFKVSSHDRSVFYANQYCQDFSADGHKYGAFLGSVHSMQQYHSMQQFYHRYTNSLCWIGLILHHKNRNVSFSWFDKTNIDENLIINSFIWCDGYPIIISNYSNNTSYTYINTSCWQNTFNPNHSISSWICGPSRSQSFKCWMVKCIVPAVLLFIVFMYSIYILISLTYNLYYFDHNWIHPPSNAVKISVIIFVSEAILTSLCATLFFILYAIGYIEYDILMPDDEYPEIYNVAYIFEFITAGLFTISFPSGYFHILLRLQNVCNYNPFFRQIIPCKFCLHFIGVLIILLPFLIELLQLENTKILPDKNQMQYRNGIGPPLIAITLAMDLSIVNGALLYYYIKGLHSFAHKHYYREDVARENLDGHCIDSRIHELMLEATRYVVLFGSVIICDVILAFIGYFVVDHNFEDYSQCRYASIVAECIFFVEVMLFLQSVHLSFKFKHGTYEKRCRYCDKCVKKMCHTIVKKRHRRAIDEDNHNRLSIPLISRS